MDEQTSFDNRQLKMMVNCIADLRGGIIDLNKFIVDQWSLVEMLSTVGDDWKKSYLSLINSVEIAYAKSLDQGNVSFGESEQAFVRLQVEEMKNMLLAAIVPEH